MEIIGAQFWDQLIVVGALVALGSALGAWLSRQRTNESKGRAEASLQQKAATVPPSPTEAGHTKDHPAQ